MEKPAVLYTAKQTHTGHNFKILFVAIDRLILEIVLPEYLVGPGKNRAGGSF